MKTSKIVLSMFMLFGFILVMFGLKMISFGTLFFIAIILGIIYWVLIAKSIKTSKKAVSPDAKIKESSAEQKNGPIDSKHTNIEILAEQAKAEQAKAEQAKAEQAKAEQAKAEQAKAEQAKAEQAKAEQAKAEQARVAQAKAEQAKAEQAKAEQAKAEQARAEHAKTEQAKAEQARAEQARAEQAKAEQARAEQAEAEQARAEQAEAKAAKKGQAEALEAKAGKVNEKKVKDEKSREIDERKTVKQVNPISMEVSEKFIPVRENWFAECVNKIEVFNKRRKNDEDQIIIENHRPGGEAEIILKVLQIKVINNYLGQYKYLEDNAGVGFKDKLKTCVFAEQSAECLNYLKKIETDKAGNLHPGESKAAQLFEMARAVAGYITSSPVSKAAAALVAENIPEFIDLTHIAGARALGDKKTVAKLSNKIENLKRR